MCCTYVLSVVQNSKTEAEGADKLWKAGQRL